MTKKGERRKGAKMVCSRLAFDDTPQVKVKVSKKKGRGNTWLAHLKKFWAKNKGKMSYSTAMKRARASYKK